MKVRTYTELSRLSTFLERFNYLRLSGEVGQATFGYDRYLNQAFYASREWKSIRTAIILRDDACDLGIEDHEIFSRILVHHMNPLTPEQMANDPEVAFDPEYLITTTHDTHNAIHYGDESLLRTDFVERSPGDTKLW